MISPSENFGEAAGSNKEEQLAKLLQIYSASEENQRDPELVEHIAALYESKKDLQSAHQWYNYAASLIAEKGAKLAMVEKVSKIEVRLLNQSIREMEEWLRKYGNPDQAAEVRSQLEELRIRKLQMEAIGKVNSKALSASCDESPRA